MSAGDFLFCKIRFMKLDFEKVFFEFFGFSRKVLSKYYPSPPILIKQQHRKN